MKKTSKIILLGASATLFMGIALGAMGAHALKDILQGKYLETYHTGIDYMIYHGLGLLALGALSEIFPQINFNWVYRLILLGVLLFSGNCIFYALTQSKFFAMIVPLGGICYLLGWLCLFVVIAKSRIKI